MQLVGHVMEELARFNPLARVSPELIIGGFSPATQCNVETFDKCLQDEIEQLQEKLNAAEEANGSLVAAFRKIVDTDEAMISTTEKFTRILAIANSKF